MPKESPDPVFMRPPGTPRHPLGSLEGVSPTCTQGEKLVHGDPVDATGYLRRYNVDSDKENDEDASQVSRVCQVAKRMGHDGGKRRGSGGGMGEAETGPI